jgi:hypothetical protein
MAFGKEEEGRRTGKVEVGEGVGDDDRLVNGNASTTAIISFPSTTSKA